MSEAKKIIHPARLSLLEQNIAEIILTFDKEIKLTLYRKYGDLSGFFVKSSMERTVFEVDQNIVRLFYSNVQDFWNKGILPEFFLKEEQKLDFTFTFKKEIPLTMHNGESFFIESKNGNIKPKNSSFKEFFLFLSREADYVRELSERKEENLFSFRFHDQLFRAIFKGGELIIENKKKNLEYHYFIGDLSKFKSKKSDYFND